MNTNNNNTEYAKQTIYNSIFSPLSDRFTASPQAVTVEPGTHEFLWILQTSWKS